MISKNKYRPKHKFKLKAKVYSWINEGNRLTLKLYVGLKTDPEVFVLYCFDKKLSDEIIQLINNGAKRLEVHFTAKQNEYQGKYYTSLIIVKASEWITIKQKIQENQYKNNIIPSFREF